jgi:hypothetical protein
MCRTDRKPNFLCFLSRRTVVSKRSIGVSLAALLLSAYGFSSYAAGNGPFPPSGDDYSPLLPAQVEYFEESAATNMGAVRGDAFPPSGDDYSPLLPAQVKYFEEHPARNMEATRGDVFPPSGDDYSPLLPAQVKYFDGQDAKTTTAEKGIPAPAQSQGVNVQIPTPTPDSMRAMQNTLRSDY